jgi:pyruvate dehydrogenase E1 component
MPADAPHLKILEQRLLWLSHWMIHHANHIRPRVDGIKTGGHQASSASMVSILTALYFHALRPEDRVAVKPHASPVFHAIQYLMGHQTRDRMENFRGLGGVQSYPSRTKVGGAGRGDHVVRVDGAGLCRRKGLGQGPAPGPHGGAGG